MSSIASVSNKSTFSPVVPENKSSVVKEAAFRAIFTMQSSAALSWLKKHCIVSLPSLAELHFIARFCLKPNQVDLIKPVLKFFFGIEISEKDQDRFLKTVPKQENRPFDQGLFVEKKKDSDETFNNALCFAALKGYLNAIKIFLQGDREISEETLGEAFYWAIFEGREEVKEFFLYDYKITDKSLGWAMTEIGIKGDLETLKKLDLGDSPFAHKAFGMILSRSVLDGHEKMKQFLFEEKKISEESLTWAILGMLLENEEPDLKTLIPEGKSIPEKSFGLALYCALKNKKEKMIPFLLKKKNVSEKSLAWAIITALQDKNEEVLSALLEFKEISQKMLSGALYQGLLIDDELVKPLFLEGKKISLETFSLVMLVTAQQENETILKFFLSEDTLIPHPILGSALYYGVVMNRGLVKAFFLDKKRIFLEILVQAAVCAVREKNLSAFIFLLSEIQAIPERSLGLIFYYVIRYRAVVIEEFLLKKQMISEKVIGWAIIIAAAQGNSDVFSFFVLKEKKISDEVLGRALYEGIVNQKESICRFFLEKIQISEEVAGWAILNAAHYGENSVFDFFKKEKKKIPKSFLEQALGIAEKKDHHQISKLISIEMRMNPVREKHERREEEDENLGSKRVALER